MPTYQTTPVRPPMSHSEGSNRTPAESHALQICTGCPVRPNCLHHALTHPETHGIWGGVIETQRRRRHAELTRATRSAP